MKSKSTPAGRIHVFTGNASAITATSSVDVLLVTQVVNASP